MPRSLCKAWYLLKKSPAILCGLGAGLWTLTTPTSCPLAEEDLSPLGFGAAEQSWDAGSLRGENEEAQQRLSGPRAPHSATSAP